MDLSLAREASATTVHFESSYLLSSDGHVEHNVSKG